jgi:hypothetical protein
MKEVMVLVGQLLAGLALVMGFQESINARNTIMVIVMALGLWGLVAAISLPAIMTTKSEGAIKQEPGR